MANLGHRLREQAVLYLVHKPLFRQRDFSDHALPQSWVPLKHSQATDPWLLKRFLDGMSAWRPKGSVEKGSSQLHPNEIGDLSKTLEGPPAPLGFLDASPASRRAAKTWSRAACPVPERHRDSFPVFGAKGSRVWQVPQLQALRTLCAVLQLRGLQSHPAHSG